MKSGIVPPRSHPEVTDAALWRAEAQYSTNDAPTDANGTQHRPALVSVTADHWRSDAQAEPGASSDARDVANYAIGRVRDLFLAALDEADPWRSVEIARHLVSCGNPLPNATCIALGLPAGSSYGAGARAVMAKAAGRL